MTTTGTPSGSADPSAPPQLCAAAAAVARSYDSLSGIPNVRQDVLLGPFRKLQNCLKEAAMRLYTGQHVGTGDGDAKEMDVLGHGRQVVLDLGCGRGGDLSKWYEFGAVQWTGVDVSQASLAALAERWAVDTAKWPDRRRMHVTTVVGDAGDPSLRAAPGMPADGTVDVVSAQFMAHYLFNTESRAQALFALAAAKLKPGGRLLLTTTDAYVLVRRLRDGWTEEPDGSGRALSFGNGWYRVTFPATTVSQLDTAGKQPYGLAYSFTMGAPEAGAAAQHVSTDNVEYLVTAQLLEALARRAGLGRVIPVTNWLEFAVNTASTHPVCNERSLATIGAPLRVMLIPDAGVDCGYRPGAIDAFARVLPEMVQLYMLGVFEKQPATTGVVSAAGAK